MKKCSLFIMLLLLVITGSNLIAGDFSISGYFKSFSIGMVMPTIDYPEGQRGARPALGAVNNRLRLKFNWVISNNLTLQTAYDVMPVIQDGSFTYEDAFFSTLGESEYRAADFGNRLFPGNNRQIRSFLITNNLDRFYLTFNTNFADIFIGRQAIAWGSGHVINPTDIISPFTFNELDTEERRGVDAVRVRVPLGMMSELDVGYVFGDKFKFENSAFFVRGKTSFLKTDVAGMLVGFRDNLMLGLDVTRSIGGAGFWCEAAYVIPGVFEKKKSDVAFSGDEENYFRVSTGLDYNFNGKFYGYCEYHFSSAGYSNADEYLQAEEKTAFREGAVYLLGKHYANIGCTYQLTPLIPINGLLIFNVSDGSLILSPTIEYNIKEDIYLSLGAYLGIGKNPGFDYDSIWGRQIAVSEFGMYPDMYFGSFRVYF